ncbi:MAG: hypothetical protein Q8781_01355 [Candidatus Phytoplasma stylosanthis]|uniref:hypothetical protein n=1 Tax=Candidatus Phytoplasma stylosanthis TaxID=2798314 RepID=UPI0029395FBB|nr:hypothetical protein [Candidatus Phytoplasma stylosanthis]MDV3167786.1 hypothetical protein [Candidatus Phytoplasma stylosanthis]MDV3170937.1 hypothetical protein [Candidatus Phytoplasma stylosanthis]MDV3173691.1 hypothetical protein [Candidatus Phytoplasma stylosanthis]MDV3174109.1 hypothetical protein [Candidatus Phytoplasma stylosanthis]MDV3202371.1 hypothetical protein [Candidatus Phytoplasma stylosanthis]
MVLKNNSEKNNIIPLLEIIQQEYRLRNIFFLIFSMLFMGIFSSFLSEYKKEGQHLFYWLSIIGFLFSFIILVISFIPFIKIITKDFFLITWPSFKKVLFKCIEVIIFTFILICLIISFKEFYKYFLDPFQSKK